MLRRLPQSAPVIIFLNWLVAFWTIVPLKSKFVLSKRCNKDNIIGTKGSSEFCCPDILLWKLNVVFLLKTVIIIWEVCTSFDPADNLRVIWKYVWLLFKKKTRIDTSSSPVSYAKLIYSEKSKKILSLFKGKGGEDLNPFKYIDQYCNVKLALIIEGIFISKTVTSLQIKVHECYVKPLKPRESLLTIEEEDEEQSDIEEITDQAVEDLVISDEENE